MSEPRFGPLADKRADAEWVKRNLAKIQQIIEDVKMSAVLRLKMSIASVKSSCDQNGAKMSEEIALQAVYGPEGSANSQWSKWTPSAGLTMHVTNPAAFGKVLPGQFYFVDLIPTDKESL